MLGGVAPFSALRNQGFSVCSCQHSQHLLCAWGPQDGDSRMKSQLLAAQLLQRWFPPRGPICPFPGSSTITLQARFCRNKSVGVLCIFKVFSFSEKTQGWGSGRPWLTQSPTGSLTLNWIRVFLHLLSSPASFQVQQSRLLGAVTLRLVQTQLLSVKCLPSS